jgi:hypothetical protein
MTPIAAAREQNVAAEQPTVSQKPRQGGPPQRQGGPPAKPREPEKTKPQGPPAKPPKPQGPPAKPSKPQGPPQRTPPAARPAPPRPEPQRPQPKKPQAVPPQSSRPQQPQRQQPPARPPQRPQQARPQQPPQPQRAQPQAQPRQERRLAQPEQQRRISEQQQRLTQYSVQLDQARRVAEQRASQLQQAHRSAQYSFQEQYIAGLNDQRQRLNTYVTYNYYNDPYFYTPPTYRYLRAGRYYETNEYGARVLREAVNDGYEQGFRAGVADRQDGWRFDYRNSYAYQDANYGYVGFYVDRVEYNYYFREGFRRGYEDGYYSRSRYGVRLNGKAAIAAGILSIILGLKSLR